MQSDIQSAKNTLRKQIRALLKQLLPERRESDSRRLCTQLREQSFFQSAKSILFFAPLSDELDLWPVLEETLAEGKIVALPRFDADTQAYKPRRATDLRAELVSGRFGIREPAASWLEMPLADLDLVLVPGVAFDLRGYRLGRGQGYYDRLLASFGGKKIGVAFDEQIVATVPAGKPDVRMDFILTPSRCIRCDE